jgi:hypothetical protein
LPVTRRSGDGFWIGTSVPIANEAIGGIPASTMGDISSEHWEPHSGKKEKTKKLVIILIAICLQQIILG